MSERALSYREVPNEELLADERRTKPRYRYSRLGLFIVSEALRNDGAIAINDLYKQGEAHVIPRKRIHETARDVIVDRGYGTFQEGRVEISERGVEYLSRHYKNLDGAYRTAPKSVRGGPTRVLSDTELELVLPAREREIKHMEGLVGQEHLPITGDDGQPIADRRHYFNLVNERFGELEQMLDKR